MDSPSRNLGRFQDEFAAALLGAAAPTPQAAGTLVASLVTQPGFAVYRNTAMKASIDALQANYPTVQRLVGEEWFRAAAARFVATAPPARPTLIEYGAGFSDFLRGFGPAAELPYLADVACLDRLWLEAHVAADADALLSAAVAAQAPGRLAAVCLCPHPAARWAVFESPAVTIWQRNRQMHELDAALDWGAEAALVTRPLGAVVVSRVDTAACALLDACAAGLPLGAAAEAALQLDPDVDLSALLLALLDAGAFRAPFALESSR